MFDNNNSLTPEEVKSQKEAAKAIPQTWKGRPSIFAFTPSALVYAIIIIVLINIGSMVHPYALHYQKYMLSN